MTMKSTWYPPYTSNNGNGQQEGEQVILTSSEKSKILHVYNSFTKTKVPFVPKSADGNVRSGSVGKTVTWYSCGPTVYDASHMGHARSYITFDIIRRIMEDYFGYNVCLVMNITDIDDKIILKARFNHLVQQYMENDFNVERFKGDLVEALKMFLAKNGKILGIDGGSLSSSASADEVIMIADGISSTKLNLEAEDQAKRDMYEREIKKALHILTSSSFSSSGSRDNLVSEVKDILAPWLDSKFGAEITDPAIFRNLAAHWENEYLKDMRALNVLPCDVMTRVSEYVPEIVSFIQKIIDNGYAYESNGSVYFDTKGFDSNPHHCYAKLCPTSKDNTKLAEEGEGSLSDGSGKKSPSDFALWKKSKPGEPRWDSPWSPGRPGWHIECSVMASDVLGSNIDIHSGGIDLAFPHHDNELAQTEAYYGCRQWINYFLHAGHLHIEGAKMSKSLKNFITIKEALEKYSSRQIRIMFLMQRWSDLLDYKTSTMEAAITFEKRILDFFSKIKAIVRDIQGKANAWEGVKHRFGQPAKTLLALLMEKENEIHEALCDSFDTMRCIKALQDFIGAVHIYISSCGGDDNSLVDPSLLIKCGNFVTRFCKIFGIIDERSGTLGLTSSSSATGVGTGAGATATSVIDNESIIFPYADLLGQFRYEVREKALDKNSKTSLSKEILEICDSFRDNQCLSLGVSLEDRPSPLKPLIKIEDPGTLLATRAEKLRIEQAKNASKAARLAEEETKKQLKAAKALIPAAKMFQEMPEHSGQYSKYDEKGIPTHAFDGSELSKSKRKKLEKEFESQLKLNAQQQI